MKSASKTTWFISDTHFFHHRIIEHCNRPFKNVKEMNLKMVDNWNKFIKPEDTVIHLGDFSMLAKKDALKDLVKKLNGTIILVKGNHDLKERELRNAGFIVFDRLIMTIANKKVLISHYPYRVNWKTLLKIKIKNILGIQAIPYKHEKRRPIDMGFFLLHGHTHSDVKFRGKQINLSAEAWNYCPVNIQEIANYIGSYNQKNSLTFRSIYNIFKKRLKKCLKIITTMRMS